MDIKAKRAQPKKEKYKRGCIIIIDIFSNK
jgi:hypothetical protein